nr:nucleoporin NUP42-like [Rhipicephalus microplus]
MSRRGSGLKVCWYYMQGRCRYGERCRNVHPVSEDYFDDEYEESRLSSGKRATDFDFNGTLDNVLRQEQTKHYRNESFQRRYGDTYHSPQTNRYSGGDRYSYQPQQHNRFQALRDTERNIHRHIDSGQRDQQRFPLFRSAERSENSQKAAALKFDFNKTLQEVTKAENNLSDLCSYEVAVVSDMKQWQASGQWLFTCYGPFGNSASYPGFCDMSMEELRLNFYNALQAGAVGDYVNCVKQTTINVQQNIQHLLLMPPDVRNCLKNLCNDQATASLPTSFSTAPSSLPQVASTTAASLFTLQPKLQSSTQQITRPVNTGRAQKDTVAYYTYSLVESLAPEQKEQFLAQHFTPGKIPVVPPPEEYCDAT